MIWLVLISLVLVGCDRTAECRAVKETLKQEDNYKRLHAETFSDADFDRWAHLLNACRGEAK